MRLSSGQYTYILHRYTDSDVFFFHLFFCGAQGLSTTRMSTATHACSFESLLLLLVGMLPHRTDRRDHSSQTGSFSKETLKPQCGQQTSPRSPRAHREQILAAHSGACWVQMLAPKHSGLLVEAPKENHRKDPACRPSLYSCQQRCFSGYTPAPSKDLAVRHTGT